MSEFDDLNRKLSRHDRDYFSYERNSSNEVCKRVIVANDSNDAIPVEEAQKGYSVDFFGEVNSVAGLATVSIIDYTVPVSKLLKLDRVECSGENKAVFSIEINSSTKSKKRSYYTEFNVMFDKLNYELDAGDNLKIIVENKKTTTADFNANFLGVLQDA